MLLDLDTIIFCGFLAINLAVGLFYSRGIKSTSEYAIGNRNFSTTTISATIISTFVGAGFFSAALIESYRQGLSFIIPAFFEPAELIIIGYFLIPRMVEFFGGISVASMMGKFYGKPVQVISGLSGMLLSTGYVALQFKVASSIMQLIFGTSAFLSLLMSAIVVVIYSSLGGIKAVTFTDLLQFLTFGAVVPLMALSIWKASDLAQVTNTISHNPLFDFKAVFDINNPHFLASIFLILFFAIPALDPAIVQRINMSKGMNQAKNSFIISGVLIAVIFLSISWTSILLLSNNPNLDPNNLLSFVIETHTGIGFKGLAAVGIMSMIMSTADSYINSATVLFTHDILKVLNFNFTKPAQEIFVLRTNALLIGILAFIIAYASESLFEIVVIAVSFYVPVVTVPLLLTIFGIRSSQKVVLIGMAAGSLAVILWANFDSSMYVVGFNKEILEETNEMIPGMLTNLIAFTIAHWIFGRPKGEKSSEYETNINLLHKQRKQYLLGIREGIQKFSLDIFCDNNFSRHNTNYFLLGFVGLITLFSALHFLPHEIRILQANLLDLLSRTFIICTSILLTYPIWKSRVNSKKVLLVLWTIIIPYTLIVVPTLFAIISKFGNFQVIMLLIDIAILAFLVRWKIALVMLIMAVYATVYFYKLYTGLGIEIEAIDTSLQFKIIYILLMFSGVIIAFLKPKQEAAELAEEKADHLSHRLEDQDKQIAELSTHKQVFLRNIQHETNTPVTGIYSMSQALQDCYDKLSDKERKNAISTIVSSSERLITYVNNLIGISKLTNSEDNLKLREVDISNLLSEALRKCKRLYIPKDAEDDREITAQIEPDLKVICDEYYIRKSFENLIINALQYCKKGGIVISLTQNKSKGRIEFIVQDSGIGIPQEELDKIFDPFVTSSKTTTPAGGRGMGLTLVKAAAEAHKGSISVKSEPKSGSVFTLSLPASHNGAE